MPHDHRPAMPQVTAVDDQFGTHTLHIRASARGTGVAVRVAAAGGWPRWVDCTAASANQVTDIGRMADVSRALAGQD